MVWKIVKWVFILYFGILIVALGLKGITSLFSPSDSNRPQVAEQTETTEPAKKAPAMKEETTESQPAEPTPEELAAAQQAKEAAQQAKALEEQKDHVEREGMDAIQEYGELYYFPYGWNLHDIWGVINVEPMSDGTWFVKAECDYENQYGNKIDGVCEAYITGSDENWTVQQFTVY